MWPGAGAEGGGGRVALAGLHPEAVGLLGWCGLSIYGVPGPELTLGGSPMGEVPPGSPSYRCGN